MTEFLQPTVIDSEEKVRLREEYVAIMQERFIDGEDAEFVNYNGALEDFTRVYFIKSTF